MKRNLKILFAVHCVEIRAKQAELPRFRLEVGLQTSPVRGRFQGSEWVFFT